MVVVAASLLQKGVEDDGLQDEGPSTPEAPLDDTDEPEEPEAVDRESLIPEGAVKKTPETDVFPPILHSPLWLEPIPMPYPINTAGGEDSPFITPCGETFYFFFTPDTQVPAEGQLLDGVTGIWRSRREEGGWGEPKKVVLSDDLTLDGCPYVSEAQLWFCSVRAGNHKEIDFWVADLEEEEVVDVWNVGERLNTEIQVGELHITADGTEIYFHSDAPGGVGDRDIWVTRLVDVVWQDAENVEAVNSEGSDSLPFLTADGGELWFTRWHGGYPAIFMSKKVDRRWSEPEMVISQFAAEPTLDLEGNIYFAHHFIEDGVMLDADIYVAYRREAVTPMENPQVPARGFYMGTLPVPHEGQGFEEAYSAVSDAGEIVPVWGKPSPFYELAEDLSSHWSETFVEGMARGSGLAPLVHMSFIDAGLTLKVPPGLEGATLSDPEWRKRYISAALDVVNASRPRFLSVGNEVNRWYERYGTGSEDGFEHFISLYEEVYDAVKEISPETQVFCTFAREVVSENREADMSVLELFDPERMDLLIITNYPYSLAGVNRPDDIPDDYYAETSSYMPGKPFGLSEIAWPSLEAFGGEEGQAELLWDVVSRLTLDQGVDLKLVMWSWLTDLSPEDTTGLIGRDGTPKAAHEAWTTIAGWGE